MYTKKLLEQLNKGLAANDRASIKDAIVQMLALDDFSPVYEAADRVRAENVGGTVHLRAIIEFSKTNLPISYTIVA